ncbi:hypothetical protein EJ05DRAFT_441690 [Pseudovirgaria hyperparasitica]|uniref:Uncharacterized protein n=1 Tax=Pseudovirgaria hyperparasitica TaxID=470096 RepID=A0A6A6W1L2_9PEZI|nr:uncharacterized protein EJ05DRAFT_441690 [Pseudovirgaria hyperparasitica]KAF2756029.1 hypothetical protein EJ05DRAFT_441690 [Pseudovirgaria hyperparasitica]
MPPQGAMGGPQGMTKEAVQQMFMKYQTMKNNGTPENDPDFIKTRTFLQRLQSQQAMQRKRAEMMQQMQQQQHTQQGFPVQPQSQVSQPQQLNGSSHMPPSSNGTSAPPTESKIPPPVSTSVPASSQAPGQQSPAAGTDAKSGPGSTSSTVFSQEQLFTLRNQIAAFKRLSKGLPLAPNMQQALFPSKKIASLPEVHAEHSRSETGESTRSPAKDASASASLDHKPYETFTSPWALLPRTVNYAAHSRRDKRPIIPSIMPTGVDVDRIREERENIVFNRIQNRLSELEKLPANIGVWDTSKSDAPTDPGSLKLKTLIEYKKLRLLSKQKALRQSIAREMIAADNLAMTANRANYRRIKKQSLREARITEKLEKQQREVRENKERKKHTDYLDSVLRQSQDVHKAGLDHRARLQKLGRTMLQTHQTIEKEEQKRVERTAKQRLQALKANDEETYLRLLGQAKDTRISHLLKQTDGFLKELASSVKAQQRSTANRYGGAAADDSSSEEDDDEDDEDKAAKVDYYEVAHKIKEDVVAQSTNLVGGTLKEYQLKGLQWMLSLYNNNLNGILADEMGLGKTIQTISLITYLIEKKQQAGPYLVVVPLSTLTNWNNEFEKWAPSVTRIVYKGPPAQRKTQQAQIRYGQFQVLLTTYEFIIKDRPVLSKIKWLHMIVDEGHRMKNANSKLSSTITQYYVTKYRIILTGTPLQNNLPELWALLNFVLPTIFKSVKSFDEWFNTPFANTGGQDKMELTEEESLLVIRRLHKVLRPFLLRRLKKDVEKDLPDKQERVIKCNMSSLQKKLYTQLTTTNKLMVSDGKGGKTGMRGLSNMLMQMRKVCNHPFVFEEVEDQVNPTRGTNDSLWRTAGKFELLDRVLPKFYATGHRVLMFFQMTQIMNIMEDFLRLRGIKYLRLDGSTKSDDRSELLRVFNAPGSEYFIFLLSTRAGGLGLNLQTADTVIIYDSDWNPHQDLQAQDRAHRIGQKNEVRILRLITSNSVEEKILERANFKLDMDGKVIQAGKFDNKSTNEERDSMLRVMLESVEAAENMEEDEQDDDDLNLIMMRSDKELEIFQQMDRDRAAKDEYGPTQKYPRLMSEAELPEIYLTDDVPVVEEIEEPIGRGARERTRVKYDDGLTEEQWLEAVDNDEDSIEAAVARKEARMARKLQRQSGVGKDSPAPSRDSSESPPPKKRGRNKKAGKRNADDASLDDGDVVAPPKKRGRGAAQAKIVETLSPKDRDNIQDILEKVYEALINLEEQGQPGDLPRGVIDLFIELPDRNDYPDYYQIIKKPICMNDVQKKINKKHYQSLKEFVADIKTLCNNCRTYNEEGSWLYNDANNIESTLYQRLREETEQFPEFQNYEDGTSADGQSTAQASGAATPMTSGRK